MTDKMFSMKLNRILESYGMAQLSKGQGKLLNLPVEPRQYAYKRIMELVEERDNGRYRGEEVPSTATRREVGEPTASVPN